MEAFLTPGLEEMWIACGTKYGKTIGAASAICAAMPLKRSSLWRWVAPIFQQSKIGFNYCRKMLPAEPFTTINRSQLPTITINQMDSRVEFWHGQNAESLEGEAVFGYIFDEASKMHEGVYDSAQTTTTITRGPKVGISTPKGKNWFYKKCMEAKEEEEWARKMGRTPKKIFITAPSSDNPAVLPSSIEYYRANLPERLFRQYYLAEFVDDGETFSDYKKCIYGDEIKVTGSKQAWYFYKDKVAPKSVVIGADWAKKIDYTVFTAWDSIERKMIGFMRFTGVNYFDAIRQLVYFCKKFQKIDMVYHDKTGLGEVVDEMLEKTSIPYEGVVFSTQSKSNMVNSFILGCEQGMPQLPYWPDMIKEMDAYEVKTTESGTMKYAAPEGMHDDIVSSMILGWKGVLEFSEHEITVRSVENLVEEEKLTVAKWYKDIVEEEDEENGWVDLRIK